MWGPCIHFSLDGLRWEEYPWNPIPLETGDDFRIIRHWGKYIAWTKSSSDNVTTVQGMQAGKRARPMSESRDLIHWAAPVQILRADEADPPGTQPYSMTAHWYGSHYVGLVSIIRDPGAETEDIRLAASRDGVNWKWVGDRSAFLPLGQKGDWDRGMLFPNPSVPFIIRGNEMLIYYCAYSNSHGMKVMFNDGRTGWLGSARNSAIGLAKLRLDGFVSVEADDSPGTLTTKSFFLHGNEVFINAACKGEIRVGLLDPEARAVEGFLVDDCEPITCDQVESGR